MAAVSADIVRVAPEAAAESQAAVLRTVYGPGAPDKDAEMAAGFWPTVAWNSSWAGATMPGQAFSITLRPAFPTAQRSGRVSPLRSAATMAAGLPTPVAKGLPAACEKLPLPWPSHTLTPAVAWATAMAMARSGR